MSRSPAPFRKRDLVTALQAAQAAGLLVARVEVGQDGRIILTTRSGETPMEKVNEWDTVYDKN